jgi:hypothetical protein
MWGPTPLEKPYMNKFNKYSKKPDFQPFILRKFKLYSRNNLWYFTIYTLLTFILYNLMTSLFKLNKSIFGALLGQGPGPYGPTDPPPPPPYGPACSCRRIQLTVMAQCQPVHYHALKSLPLVLSLASESSPHPPTLFLSNTF